MQRTKFRAWDKDRKRFTYFDLTENPARWTDKLGTNLSYQQFTDIKDLGGKDIYEGDIVEVTTPDGASRVGAVADHLNTWCVTGEVRAGLYALDGWGAYNINVIGSIFEGLR